MSSQYGGFLNALRFDVSDVGWLIVRTHHCNVGLNSEHLPLSFLNPWHAFVGRFIGVRGEFLLQMRATTTNMQLCEHCTYMDLSWHK